MIPITHGTERWTCLTIPRCPVGGILAGSLAIVSDAAHLLTDLASFLVSLLALYLGTRPATKKLSFGWYRAGNAQWSLFLSFYLSLFSLLCTVFAPLCVSSLLSFSNSVSLSLSLMDIKEPLLLIGKNSLCGGSGFSLSLYEWS